LGEHRCRDHDDRGDSTNYREVAEHKVRPPLAAASVAPGDGRKAGTAEGYAYSDSNKNSGIVWSEASLKE
jgi:cytochrome c